MEIDDDVTVFVFDGVQRQRIVFASDEDITEDGCDTFDDAEIEFGLRDEVAEMGEDETELGIGDFEGDAVLEYGWVWESGGIEWSFCVSSVDILH